MKYKKIKKDSTYLKLEDIATTLEYGNTHNDRRIQVKMPSFVVDQLDKVFPDIDRSKLFVKLAVAALLNKYRFADKPELGKLVESEQQGLDEMWSYLEERDAS